MKRPLASVLCTNRQTDCDAVWAAAIPIGGAFAQVLNNVHLELALKQGRV